MIIKINSENGNIKTVNMEFTSIEFLLIRKLLNLKCVYAELSESDGKTAERLYKELDRHLKEIQRK